MTIVQYTASGEAHKLVNILANSVEDNDFKHCSPEVKTKLQKQKKEDAKVAKYEYVNRKGKHERLTKPYCRYAGDPIHMYNLIPGKVYDLPKGFVDEVNQMKGIVRSGLVSRDGNEVNKDGSPLQNDTEADWEHRLIPVGF